MTTERWRRIEAIFELAAGLSGDERSSYLEQSCAGDTELLQEVQDLLELDGKASRLLQSGIQREAEHLVAAASESVAGQRVGQYRISKTLGRGGMGVVYLATREDDVYEKPVALKLVKRGMDSEEVVRRFRQERRILSRLDHPNIARLLDGGSAEDGRPYFVMEYLEGEPLASFASRLPLRGKLELFREVCGAVEYAHRNLVVHRDLKLGNMLVTANGTPKLLDFGIAKLLTPDDSERTAAELRLLTPEYASPEQWRGGEAVTTASDVFSLGRVLSKLAGDEARGELRQIIEMACREMPERRYASVAEFSEDIRRYLAGLPVLARPDTLSYRVAKFVNRNRWHVGTASVAIVGLIGTTVFALRQAREAGSQRMSAEAAKLIAQTEARRAEEQRALAVAETRRANLATGEALRETQRAETARAQANLQAERSRRFAVQVASNLNFRLHFVSGALETRDGLARATLASLQQMVNDAPADQELQFDLARAYLTMAMVHYHIGNNSHYRLADALSNIEKGRELVIALRRRDPGNKKFQALDYALSNQLGLTLREMGQLPQSLDTFRKNAPVAEGLEPGALQAIGYGGGQPASSLRIAEVLVELGEFRPAIEMLPDGSPYKAAALAATGDLDTGWRWLSGSTRSLPARMGRRFAADTALPALARHHLALISGHPLLLNRCDTATAVALTRQNIQVFTQVLAAEPSDGNSRSALSEFHHLLGTLLRDSAPGESVASFRTVIRFTLELLDRSSANLKARRRLAAVHAEMALPLRKLGRMPEARESLRASREIEDSLGEPRSFTRAEWGDLELEAGHREEALDHYQAALRLVEARIGERPQDMNSRRELADVFEKFGYFHESAGEARQAREWYARSLSVWRGWTKYGVSSVYNERREKAAAELLARLREE